MTHDPTSTLRSRNRTSTALNGVALLVVAGTLAGIGWVTAGPVLNRDTYFHLRIGGEFLNGWSITSPDTVTRFASAEWQPTQWLSQIAMAGAESAGGLTGVAALTGVAVVLMSLCFFVAGRSQGSLAVTALLLPIALLAASSGLSGRPQVVSYAFVALVTAAWLVRARGGPTPWWIIPLTWVWAMTHGMWSVSVIVSVAAVAGMALDKKLSVNLALRLLSIPVLSLGAALATPLGVGVLTASSQVSDITAYFSEWGPPRFTSPNVLMAWILVAIIVFAMARSTERTTWSTLLLAAVAGVWLVYSIRTVPVAAAMLLPLAVAQVSRAAPAPRRATGEVVGVLIGAVLALGLTAMHALSGEQEHLAKSPAYASVAHLPAGTGLLTSWSQGGYDMWRLPHLDITSHGYCDMFTTAELERNRTVEDLAPEWYAGISTMGVRHAILPADSALAHELVTARGWTTVAADPKSASESPMGRYVHLQLPEQ